MSAVEESIDKRAFGIGWEFVKEYYTIMHREPQSLYKFYGNNSYFCYGLEGESTQYCHGKDEIRKRINDIDYNGCRVVVSNVDSQPSDNGGIIVQVLGEMLNRDEQAIKFAQTFFLAVQQGGYYVLNDIFRHLKDEVNEEYEELMQQAEEEKEEEVKNESSKVEEPPAKTEKAETKETKSAPVEESKPAPAKEKKTAAEAVASKPASNQKSASAKEAAAASTKEASEASKPTAAKVAAAAAEAKPASTAAAPSRPMTYSSIASSSAKSWSKVAQGDGTGAKPAQVVVKQTTTTTTQKHQENRNNNSSNGNNNNNNNNNNQDKDSHTVFIKLPFTVAKEEISNALNKFGEIKNIEINGQKNYAFVEFATVEQTRKAIQSGEFVVNNTKINIEERKRNNKNHGNGRMNSSYNNRGGRSDYNRNYSGGSRGSNDSNNMGSRRGGSNNGKRPYKN